MRSKKLKKKLHEMVELHRTTTRIKGEKRVAPHPVRIILDDIMLEYKILYRIKIK